MRRQACTAARTRYRVAGGHAYRWWPGPRWLGLCLLALLWTAAAGAETLRGTPLLRRYLPQDYNATPQHWAIATDRDGRLFVGNAEGVLRYDGEQWSLIQLPGKQVGRELATGRDGHIYVGSYDTFGWLRESPDGEIVFQELLTSAGLKGRARNVGNVWQVLAADDGVYFRGETTLHFLSYDRKVVRAWPMPEHQRSMVVQGKTLYGRLAGVGFSRFVDGKYVLEPGGALFADQVLAGMIPRGDWRLLVGGEGFFRADASGITPIAGGLGSELRGKHAYTVLPLDDGSFVVGTLTGELFRYGPDYALRNRVTLGSFGITALGADREGGLWAATEGDLVRMSLPSPWSFLGAAQGMAGTVFDFDWHQDALWLATSRGLWRMRTSDGAQVRADETGWTDLEAFAVTSTDSGLLVAHRNGLLVLDPGATAPRPLLETESEGVSELVPARDGSRVYALGDQRLFVLQATGGRWGIAATVPLDGAAAFGLIEAAPGDLWFGDSRGGPQRVQLDLARGTVQKRDVFGARLGLDLDASAGSSVYLLDGVVHAVSGERGFRLANGRFVADVGPPFTLADRKNELLVEQTPLGAYAFTRRQLFRRPLGKTQWEPVYLGSQLAAGYSRLRVNRDGVLRLATWSGLLQFDPDEKQPAPAPLSLGFALVTAESPDGQQLLRLPVVSQGKTVEIPSGYRLHFRYAMVSMDSGAEFKYRLNGAGDVPDAWSNWTDRDLFIRAITPGEYLLEVKGRTRSGREAPMTSYRYRILPQWHELRWVRGLGALLLLALGVMLVHEIVRRRTQRYVEANRRLESRIGERTHELEAVNRKLAELATEDALTGVANRRALENGLQREWYRCLDQRRPLSVMMIDVDHFKRYNDAHGHLEGDVLLRDIAQRLHELHDPKRELLARYGGEEFALLLPGVHQDEAQRRAELIRQAMAGHLGDTTISIGVAGFVPGMHADAMTLLRRADAALYRAKRGGRNRVEADSESS